MGFSQNPLIAFKVKASGLRVQGRGIRPPRVENHMEKNMKMKLGLLNGLLGLGVS